MLLSQASTGRYEVPHAPSDSISCLSWLHTQGSPHLLACSSWDKSVRVWGVSIVGQNVQANPKTLYNHEAPALSCAISRNGCVFSGGCDTVVRMHNMQTQQTTTIGKHDAPVSNVFVCEEKGLILSAGWDKTVKLWDTRSPNPGLVYNLGTKICAADFKYPVLAVGKADRVISLFNLETLSPQPAMTIASNLKFQLRCISIFADKKGFALGSIEARCGIMYIDEAMRSKNFPFKCHRYEDKSHGTRCFPLNAIDFNSVGSFATAGADGSIACWDKDNRQRLRCLDNLGSPVTTIKFDPTSAVLAYGLSYDWHKGYAFSDPAKNVNKVILQAVTDDMLKPRTLAPQRAAGRR